MTLNKSKIFVDQCWKTYCVRWTRIWYQFLPTPSNKSRFCQNVLYFYCVLCCGPNILTSWTLPEFQRNSPCSYGWNSLLLDPKRCPKGILLIDGLVVLKYCRNLVFCEIQEKQRLAVGATAKLDSFEQIASLEDSTQLRIPHSFRRRAYQSSST